MEKLIEAKKLLEEAQNNMKGLLKDQLAVALIHVIDEYGIESVKWNQYAPSYNDGDPCIFRVNDWEVKFKDQDDYSDTYSLRYDEHGNTLHKYEGLDKYLSSVFALLDDDIMQTVFGSDAEITFTKENGFRIEEYDHE